MTALAPSSAALEIATVMPRSLNEPVGLAPSTLRYTSQSVLRERPGAGSSGVPPSNKVITGVALVTGNRDRYASITPGQALFGSVTGHPFHAHHARDAADELHAGEPIDGLGQRRIGGAVRDDDQGRGVAAPFLADGLDADVLLGERPGDAGQHARTIGDVKSHVVARRDVAHRLDRQLGVGAVTGTPAAADPVAGHGDEVAEHGAGS